MCQPSTCIYIPLWGLLKWVVLLLLGKILVLFWDYKSSQIMNYSFRWELKLALNIHKFVQCFNMCFGLFYCIKLFCG
jgi:hypothetical protein